MWRVMRAGQEGQATEDEGGDPITEALNQEWCWVGSLPRKPQARGHKTVLRETPQMPKISARPEALLWTTHPQVIL